ncbi:MAG TPA: tetratricopeptide repeat protein [Cellvibrio sp.]|nr:tetratricopeptide repeat protein [Cellvibrio sp.]
MLKKYPLLSLALLCISGCSSPQPQDTLGSIDVVQEKKKQVEVSAKPKPAAKSEEEIKNAYYNYINNAPSNDKSRRVAINRLAELELSRLNQQAQKNSGPTSTADTEQQNTEALKKSMALLQTSLREYPDAKDNDRTLYQLARTQDQLGEMDASLETLAQLCKKYPNSAYYAESQFRIAENAFIQGDYITAEAAYTEITFNRNGDAYLERALFKRGWTRYKQAIYSEAADDYLAAIDRHQFAAVETLSAAEKDQYDEYLRALGLTLSSLPSVQEIQTYLADKANESNAYPMYEAISAVYLEQERYSDAAAVLDEFITAHANSAQVPFAHLKKIEVWAEGKFKNRFIESLDTTYAKYNAKSAYWNSHKNPAEQDKLFNALRPHVLRAANYAQEEYQQNHSAASFSQANLWYKRYLEQYTAYAQQDKVYTLYAELLTDANQNQEAMRYFELAAYDGNIVLNKEAAYATVVLSNKLYEQDKSNRQWLDKHIRYTLLSAQLYQRDTRYHTAALHAAELALNNQRYDDAITLTNSLSNNASDKLQQQANMIKGLAYLQKKSLADAETIFSDLLKQTQEPALQKQVQDNLALSIYQQAESDVSNNRVDAALQNFSRIAKRAPTSDIAPKALYEAIALAMKHEQWTPAIGYIQQFQTQYPKHELNKDATRQLSIAYLNAGDGAKAAQTFEQIAAQEQNQDVKMATLWKAAELYESKHNNDAAIRSYSTYAENYTRPYPQYMEALYKLTQLNKEIKDNAKVDFWQGKIMLADSQAAKAIKTERTNFIAANTQLEMAKKTHTAFSQKQLVEPLADNLKAKKKLMQEAIAAYGQASTYNNPGITTEATYAIGNIYQQFSSALLKSERPRNLKGEELEQYNILIEDQAFPFEEKAIEFYEINMAHIQEGVSSAWINQSYQELGKLFPVRYNRKGKADIYQDENP